MNKGHDATTILRLSRESIDQREFDSFRHGTVQFLAYSVVHTRHLRVVVFKQHDVANDIAAQEEFDRRHRRIGGGSLFATATRPLPPGPRWMASQAPRELRYDQAKLRTPPSMAAA